MQGKNQTVLSIRAQNKSFDPRERPLIDPDAVSFA